MSRRKNLRPPPKSLITRNTAERLGHIFGLELSAKGRNGLAREWPDWPGHTGSRAGQMSYSETFTRRTQAYQDAVDSGYDRSSFVVELLEAGYAWKPVIDADDDQTQPTPHEEEPGEETEEAEEAELPESHPTDQATDYRTKLTLQLDGEWYGETGMMWAGKIAKMLRKEGIGIRVLNADSGAVINVCSSVPTKDRKPGDKPKPVPRAERDWSVKPVITSAANQHTQRLIDKIAEAEGNATKLRALDTFNRTSTYYKLAGRYLDELLARAEPKMDDIEEESTLAA